MFTVFTRTWWAENPEWPNGLEPAPGRKTILKRNIQCEGIARQMCVDYRRTHNPGRLSRKAEYERQ